METTATATAAPAAAPASSQASAPASPSAEAQDQSLEDFLSDEEIAKLSAKKLKLKVDGKESAATIEQLIRDRQKYESATKRFQEAKELYQKGEMSQKQLKEFVGYMKNNTAEALKHLGIDPRQFAESFLTDALQYETLSPEQRELIDAKKRLSTYENEAKTRQEQEKRAKFQAEVEQHRQSYDKEFAKALSAAGIENDAYAIDRLARYMMAAIKKGNRDASPMDFVDQLKADFQTQSLSYLKRLPAERLLQEIPAEIIDRIRKADLERVKAIPQATRQPAVKHAPSRDQKQETLTPDQFRQRMLERLGK